MIALLKRHVVRILANAPRLQSSTPFLIRTFVKQGPGFHPIEDFEDGLEPLKDEYALWAW